MSSRRNALLYVAIVLLGAHAAWSEQRYHELEDRVRSGEPNASLLCSALLDASGIIRDRLALERRVRELEDREHERYLEREEERRRVRSEVAAVGS